MNAKLVTSVVMALIIGLALSSIWQHEARANPIRPEGLEYKLISLRHDPDPLPQSDQEWSKLFETRLNAAAKDGWEYAGPMGTGFVALKRAKK